jgi:hypothetical protein
VILMYVLVASRGLEHEEKVRVTLDGCLCHAVRRGVGLHRY